MRQTSIDVYNQIKNEGLLSKLRWVVYDAVYEHGPMTAQETWHLLRDAAARRGEARINGITPRFSELERFGVIRRIRERPCRVTGRNCDEWDVTDSLPGELDKPETSGEKIKRLERRIKELEEMNREFQVHILNEKGIAKAKQLAEAFDMILNIVTPMCEDPRCLSLVRTKLEEASFFAKKGMAMSPANQKEEDDVP